MATQTTPLLSFKVQAVSQTPETCYICTENLYNENGQPIDTEGNVDELAIEILGCRHSLHRTCYEDQRSSGNHCCGLCRAPFTESYTVVNVQQANIPILQQRPCTRNTIKKLLLLVAFLSIPVSIYIVL